MSLFMVNPVDPKDVYCRKCFHFELIILIGGNINRKLSCGPTYSAVESNLRWFYLDSPNESY